MSFITFITSYHKDESFGRAGGLLSVQKMYVLTTKKHPITHGTCTRDTRHEARCARKLGYYMPPKLVPAQGTQSCGKPCCFRRDRYYDEQKKHLEKWMIPGRYEITPQKENPGYRLIHFRRKKSSERTPHATHCTDRAQSSTTVSGRTSSVDLLGVCANGTPTKGYERKSIKISRRYTYARW